MIKVKFFWGSLDNSVQNWLNDNQGIEVVSTNLTSNDYGSVFCILYKERKSDNG